MAIVRPEAVVEDVAEAEALVADVAEEVAGVDGLAVVAGVVAAGVG